MANQPERLTVFGRLCVCVCPGKPCPHKDGNMQNYGPCVGKFLICMFGAVRLRSGDNKPQIILFI